MTSNDTFEPLLALPFEWQATFNRFGYKNEASVIWAFLIQFLDHSSREFFPEWTDHALPHAIAVLDNCVSFTRGDIASHLTPEDIFCLVTSVLIHDAAMNFSRANFARIIEPIAPNSQGASWADFCAEAKHWDDQTLRKVFGNDAVVPDNLDINSLDPKALPVAGEFLRRIHGQVAADLCETNFSAIAPSDPVVKFLEHSEGSLRDLVKLSGLIASSHTVSLRSAIESTKRSFGSGGVIPSRSNLISNAHYPFLMAILRVADYADFRNSTSQHFLKHSAHIANPISRLEFETMAAFRSINFITPHEELMLHYHTIEPAVERRFLSYCSGLQNELDVSWAVLSEYYPLSSPATGLTTLGSSGLTIRRVTPQNISSPNLLARYHPESLSIQIFGTDIIYLLAGPLYNDDPRFPLREILSNAHDACSEAKRLGAAAEPSISLTINSESNSVICEDTGIGMTVEDISGYFLHIGGRLRDSLAWKSDASKTSHSSVTSYPYSSRFGVGVISLFLLGGKISLQSKKRGNPGALITLEPNLRELFASIVNPTEGTKVKIEAYDHVLNGLAKHWQQFRPKMAAPDDVPAKSFAKSLHFLINFTKYVPFDFDLRVLTDLDGPSRVLNFQSLTKTLQRFGTGWVRARLSESLKIDVQIMPRADTENPATLIYNGIPTLLPKELAASRMNIADIIFIRDDSNSLTFNLQKSVLNDITCDVVKKAYEACYINLLENMSVESNGHSSQGPFLSSHIPIMLSPELSWGEKGLRDGCLPLGYLWDGNVVALTSSGINRCKCQYFLVLQANQNERAALLELLPREIPTIFLDPRWLSSHKPGLLTAQTVLRWHSGSDPRNGGKLVGERNCTPTDTNMIRNYFAVSSERKSVVELFLQKCSSVNRTDGSCSLGVVGLADLRKVLAPTRQAFSEVAWMRPYVDIHD